MAVTIVATPGATNANSYLTLAEAETYFESRLHIEEWTAATVTTDKKNRALVMATRVIDVMYDWVGLVHTETQALLWPRYGVLAFNEFSWVPETEIPSQLKNATAELAMQLITEDRTLDSDIEKLKITSLRAGPVSLSFGAGVTSKIIPDAVYHLIPPWWGDIRSRRAGYYDLERA